MLDIVGRAPPDSFWIRWAIVGANLVQFLYSENRHNRERRDGNQDRHHCRCFTYMITPDPHTVP